MGMYNGTATLENGSWRFLKKLNEHLPYDLTIPLLCIYLIKNQAYAHTKTIIETLSVIAPNWNQPTCLSTGSWINKLRYSHKMEYYSAIKGMNTQKHG